MKIFLLLFIIFILSWGGVWLPVWLELTAGVNRITATEARRMMLSGAEDFVLLDVRSEQEFMGWRIAGARLFPYDRIRVRARSLLPDRDQVILVYCHSGRRSAIAAEQLVRMGYRNVYDFGGIYYWPYEVLASQPLGG